MIYYVGLHGRRRGPGEQAQHECVQGHAQDWRQCEYADTAQEHAAGQVRKAEQYKESTPLHLTQL
jgi:hypothetical protein